MNGENTKSFNEQGDKNDMEELLGGTTNLSADQLKDEGGIANTGKGNTARIEQGNQEEMQTDEGREKDPDDRITTQPET